MKQPLILVTNDDGIFAPGIAALVEVARKLGEVVVVAPNSPQSGKGHGITITDPLRLHKVKTFEGIPCYECSGTPVDCVKLARHVVLKDRHIDICVSGINHGSNSSINIIYSGTMSAAMEASIEGTPAIGFSYLDYSFEADFTACKIYVEQIMQMVLRDRLNMPTLLNVNIPKLSAEKIKGFKICRQAEARYTEEFIEGKDPAGRSYYWLTGKFVNHDRGEDSDVWALENGYVSIVPSWHDLTNYKAVKELKEIWMQPETTFSSAV